MRQFAQLTDRMLSVVAPRVTAAAVCPGTFYETCEKCARSYNHVWQKRIKECHYTGLHCSTVCGACYTVSCSPP